MAAIATGVADDLLQAEPSDLFSAHRRHQPPHDKSTWATTACTRYPQANGSNACPPLGPPDLADHSSVASMKS
jgi:hypothetical protein